MKRHERYAEKNFEESLLRYLAAGAHVLRGLSKQQYIDACRTLWHRTKTDDVYKMKLFVEPIVDTKLAMDFTDQFCILSARCDPDGNLIDARSGYERPPEPNVFLHMAVFGSPVGKSNHKPPSGPNNYLLAYFDILGFKNYVRNNALKTVHDKYLELIDQAVGPQKASWIKSHAVSSRGELVPALMWMPTEVAYSSDSIILYVKYAPELSLIEELLFRAALLFCSAIRCGVPLRGVITHGEGVFDNKKSVYIGNPLIEASMR